MNTNLGYGWIRRGLIGLIFLVYALCAKGTKGLDDTQLGLVIGGTLLIGSSVIEVGSAVLGEVWGQMIGGSAESQSEKETASTNESELADENCPSRPSEPQLEGVEGKLLLFTCNCGRRFKLHHKYAGTEKMCFNCGKMLIVPSTPPGFVRTDYG